MIKRTLPLFSLLWGVASAFLMGRDFDHGVRLLVFFVGFVLVSVILSFWFIVRERSDKASGWLLRIARAVNRRSLSVEWLGFALLQTTTQYIFFFSLPFLYFARAWIPFSLLSALAASTLWDPWWQKFVRVPGYWGTLRIVCFLLVASLGISIFLPDLLRWHDAILSALALVAAAPWSLAWSLFRQQRQMSRRRVVAELLPLVVAALLCLVTLLGVQVVPPLGIWLRSAQLGIEIDDHALVRVFEESVEREDLRMALAEGHPVCCLTPIVAAKGVSLELVHEWLVDGALVDTIFLGEVQGLDEKTAFRTYSCKRAIPSLDVFHTLSCHARLVSGNRLGKVSIRVARPRND